jgi:hypothetical protein
MITSTSPLHLDKTLLGSSPRSVAALDARLARLETEELFLTEELSRGSGFPQTFCDI